MLRLTTTRTPGRLIVPCQLLLLLLLWLVPITPEVRRSQKYPSTNGWFTREFFFTHVPHPTDERQTVTLKVYATDVIAILATEPARLPVLQVGGIHR